MGGEAFRQGKFGIGKSMGKSAMKVLKIHALRIMAGPVALLKVEATQFLKEAKLKTRERASLKTGSQRSSTPFSPPTRPAKGRV